MAVSAWQHIWQLVHGGTRQLVHGDARQLFCREGEVPGRKLKYISAVPIFYRYSYYDMDKFRYTLLYLNYRYR